MHDRQPNATDVFILEQYIDDIWNALPIPIITINNFGVISECSDAVEKLFEESKDFIIGKPICTYMSRSDYQKIQSVAKQHGSIKNAEVHITAVSGIQKLVSLSAMPRNDADGLIIGIFISLIDITEQKKIHDEVIRSEQKFRNIFESLHTAMFMFQLHDDDSLILINYNSAAQQLIADTPDIRIGSSYHDIFTGFTDDTIEKICRSIAAGDTSWHADSIPFTTATDSIYFEIDVFNTDNNYVVMAIKDITQRTTAENNLAEERERLAVTMTSITNCVISTDIAGNIILFNPIAESLCGWYRKSAIGKPIDIIVRMYDEKNRKRITHPVSAIIHTNRMIPIEDSILVSNDGTEHIVTGVGAPLRNDTGTVIGTVIVLRDITQERRIEEERLKSTKLESIGILAGGIAHDFNNIMTTVLGNISLAKNLSTDKELIEVLDEAEKASLRAKDLTYQLLTFSKSTVLIRSSTDIRELIKNAVKFALYDSNITPILHIDESLSPVIVDEDQMSQILNNLIINAQQAMPNGGSLHLRAQNVSIQNNPSLPLKPGSYVIIEITDSGTGISPENINKIYDPYFTTKTDGTGLGLAMCYAIIQKYDGYIDVKSEPGKGTSFFIYLPTSTDIDTVQQRSHPDNTKNKKSILIIDDDITILKVTKRILMKLGYAVETAHTGEEGIQLYKNAVNTNHGYDVVITDLVIKGGMGGKETITQLMKINPKVKAIVSSGYSDDPIISNYSQYGFSGVIQKPYKIQDLSDAIYTLIH